MSTLELPVIPSTSPTLAETMRSCGLCAGLSRAAGVGAFVLGNPKAWLGTVYHEVLEKIAKVDLEKESVESAVGRLWTQALVAANDRRSAHALDRRFGLPETWPGYHAARASVLLRARELVAGLAPPIAPGAAAPFVGANQDIRERKFEAFDGRLVGKPDVVRKSEVIDYKSGRIVEFDEAAQADVVKAAYVRQLRIYGYLVNQTLGWWPKRGVLLPLIGAGVDVDLDAEDCAREAAEAVELLTAYNDRAVASESAEALASPSKQNCRWCSYKLICPAFWQAALPQWSGELDGAAIEGTLTEGPTAVHSGAAMAITLDIERGTEARRCVRIAPLNPTTHLHVGSLVAGARLRIVGLRVRPNGEMSPGERTVLWPVDTLPTLASASAQKAHLD